jgi:hypothetical protein
MSRRARRCGVIVIMSILSSIMAASFAVAQTSPHDAAFIVAAKRAAAAYRTQDAAIADGFRPVGVEFPAMGEHWVSLQRVMANTIDPALPSVLIYVTIGGHATLGGVGYTKLLRKGEPLPSSPASGYWHEHNGSVAEESFPLRHHMGSDSRPGRGDELRLAILHLWTEIPNDAGPFATDNWRLPLRRLGTVTLSPTVDALQAIALAQDETGYFALMLRVALEPTDREEAIITRALSDHRAAAIKQVASLRVTSPSTRVQDSAKRELTNVWQSLWRTLAERMPSRRAQLSALRSDLESDLRPTEQTR